MACSGCENRHDSSDCPHGGGSVGPEMQHYDRVATMRFLKEMSDMQHYIRASNEEYGGQE